MTAQNGAMDTSLIQKIRAELNETERVALAATPGPWTAVPVVYGPPEQGWGRPSNYEVESGDGASVVSHQTYEGGGSNKEDATHIARHDPARVLRHVASMRKVLDKHERLDQANSSDRADIAERAALWRVIRLLAEAYDIDGRSDTWT